MGGKREAILTFELGDAADVRATLGKFDASKARCFLTKDRERLLAVIEAGYGDLHAFNVEVRLLLSPRGDTAPTEEARPRDADLNA